MKSILLILTLVLGHNTILFGQADSVEQIEQSVKGIDNDSTLTIKEYDATEVYDQTFDGGGLIKVYFDQDRMVKIDREIGVSFGRLTTIIYFENGDPIKIIDREENFKWREDQTGWDYSEINQVFQADIYVFDWKMD